VSHFKLIDLPTIIESHKTIDKKVLYKTGDISQMIMCSPEVEEGVTEEKVNVEEMSVAKKKDLYKKFLSNHGSECMAVVSIVNYFTCFPAVTPPLKNVRKRRFRKTKIKKVRQVV